MPALKSDLVPRILDVFLERGYDGATLVHLASAAGLSKASLYHHYPGGKVEMAAALVHHAIADLQNRAFNPLQTQPPREGIVLFVSGFSNYVQGGHSDCILSILGRHLTAHEEISPLKEAISAQFNDWQHSLAAIYEQLGCKPKRANREAQQLLSSLYGALLTSKMHNKPELFARAIKRIQKELGRTFEA